MCNYFINKGEMDGKINRIKVMLVDRRHTNRWQSDKVPKAPATVRKGIPIQPVHTKDYDENCAGSRV